MPRKTSRRAFMQETAAIGIGLWAAGGVRAEESKSANEVVRFACIGIGGKGDSDSADAGRSGDVVAICDIDDARLESAGSKKFTKAKRFNDYRKMFDEMDKSIDAVTVSTPDHHHMLASYLAMKHGKACFTQKPLTHSVWEARFLAETAKEMKVATQMGNQGTAGDPLRAAAAYIKAGKLGGIKEVHVWTNRPIWPQGGPRPKPADKVPENVHWDLFIGGAPFREYGPGYHPFAWRGWWDFGTGALGDMACHTFNMPFMALDLKNPTSIEAEHSGHNKDSYPAWSIIKFAFPATDLRGAIPVVWYDGGKKPDPSLFNGKDLPASGALIVGEKDTLHAHGDYCGEYSLLSGAKPDKVAYVKSPGHFEEYVRAIKGGEQAMSNFPNYAGPLTETILLGNLAVWCGKGPDSDGKKVEWDSKNLRATNAPELDVVIKPPYREGWGV
ncbi:MAG TPA: Gfo/Idh/MocA family oxidoreductase [Planctomycetaceae bacterium]|nr:Gfo/Idh/MocA family oxidoreductase [Planctomycetaceae bacterium]